MRPKEVPPGAAEVKRAVTGTLLQGSKSLSVTVRQANGNREMFGPMEAKSCKPTERFDTALIQVGFPS